MATTKIWFEDFSTVQAALARVTELRAAGHEAKVITHGGGTTGRAQSFSVKARA